MDALGRILVRLLVDMPECSMSNGAGRPCGEACPMGEYNGLLAVLGHFSNVSLADVELAERLDRALELAWSDLAARYEAHQLRLVGSLQAHVENDDGLLWLHPPVRARLLQVRVGIGCQDAYPADDVECVLRFHAMVWFLADALKDMLKNTEEDGWRSLELALLVAETFKRQHLEESAGVDRELEVAMAESNDVDQAMWAEFKRYHEAWFARWWAVFGPLHAWLCEEMQLCPSGLDKVYRNLGDDAWNLTLLELVERARVLLK